MYEGGLGSICRIIKVFFIKNWMVNDFYFENITL